MRGAYVHAFQTNGQIGHTRLGPRKLRWTRAPRSLNPSLSPTPTTITIQCFHWKNAYQFSIKKLMVRVILE